MDGSERPMRQAFIRHLVANTQCPGCGDGYLRNDIYVLGHHEDVWVAAVVCSRCGTQGLVFAMLRDQEHFEITNDIQSDEMAALAALPPLSIDDVLDLHQFLKDFHGDVDALLHQGERQDK